MGNGRKKYINVLYIWMQMDGRTIGFCEQSAVMPMCATVVQ